MLASPSSQGIHLVPPAAPRQSCTGCDPVCSSCSDQVNLFYLNKNREEKQFIHHGFDLVVLTLDLCILLTTKLVSRGFLTLLRSCEQFPSWSIPS